MLSNYINIFISKNVYSNTYYILYTIVNLRYYLHILYIILEIS